MLTTKFEKATFVLDAFEGEEFGGYTQGETWNGFECPYFPFDSAKHLMTVCRGGERGKHRPRHQICRFINAKSGLHFRYRARDQGQFRASHAQPAVANERCGRRELPVLPSWCRYQVSALRVDVYAGSVGFPSGHPLFARHVALGLDRLARPAKRILRGRRPKRRSTQAAKDAPHPLHPAWPRRMPGAAKMRGVRVEQDMPVGFPRGERRASRGRFLRTTARIIATHTSFKITVINLS